MDETLRWLTARETLDMFWRLSGLRHRAGMPTMEETIAQIAFEPSNTLRTKAVSASGGVDLGDDGSLPATFWDPDGIKVFATSSNWNLGIVAGCNLDQKAVAHGVRFCLDDLERLIGPDTRAKRPAGIRPALALEAVIEAGNDSESASMPVGDSGISPKRQKIPYDELKAWWADLQQRGETDYLSIPEIWGACERARPQYRVVRQQIEDLVGPSDGNLTLGARA